MQLPLEKITKNHEDNIIYKLREDNIIDKLKENSNKYSRIILDTNCFTRNFQFKDEVINSFYAGYTKNDLSNFEDYIEFLKCFEEIIKQIEQIHITKEVYAELESFCNWIISRIRYLKDTKKSMQKKLKNLETISKSYKDNINKIKYAEERLKNIKKIFNKIINSIPLLDEDKIPYDKKNELNNKIIFLKEKYKKPGIPETDYKIIAWALLLSNKENKEEKEKKVAIVTYDHHIEYLLKILKLDTIEIIGL